MYGFGKEGVIKQRMILSLFLLFLNCKKCKNLKNGNNSVILLKV